MKSVYIVGDGEYSDYRVMGIYSSRRLAEKAKKLLMADNDIKEMELNAMPPHPPGTILLSVLMDKEGTTYHIRQVPANRLYPKWEPGSLCDVPRRMRDDIDYRTLIVFCVWAKDERGAVKVANERRAALLANDMWTTDRKTWEQYIKGGVDVFGEAE